MSFSINQLRDFSSLFSRSEVKRWQKNDFESIILKLERYNLYERYKGNSYLSFLRSTYKILEKNYPNEYVIKNEFLNQWLRKELDTEKSIIFNEFRIGKAIADLAMFNGISKVFEIKTILDKEYRLSNQLQEYKKVFNEIYVIVPETHVARYLDFDETIGLISFNLALSSFEIIRKSERNLSIENSIIMDVLHTNEYKEIVEEHFKVLPEMNAFNQYIVCKELILKIPHEELNRLFIKTMKKRKVNNSFFARSNKEFNQICLSLNLKQKERDRLIDNLKVNID